MKSSSKKAEKQMVETNTLINYIRHTGDGL